jgi:hypothetical protein
MTKVMSDRTFYVIMTIVNTTLFGVVILIGNMPFAFGVMAGLAYATMLHQAAKHIPSSSPSSPSSPKEN